MTLVVAAVIVNEKGEVLIQKRPKDKPFADFWEFPGGKVEAKEDERLALVRELYEELALSPLADDFVLMQEINNTSLCLKFYRLELKEEIAPKAMEHQQWLWADKKALKQYQFLPLNQKIVEILVNER